MSRTEEDADPRFPISELPARLASMGLPRRSPEVCRRWTVNGHGGVKLASTRVGSRRYTTMSAVRAFLKGAKLL